jgi:hypothetical protein
MGRIGVGGDARGSGGGCALPLARRTLCLLVQRVAEGEGSAPGLGRAIAPDGDGSVWDRNRMAFRGQAGFLTRGPRPAWQRPDLRGQYVNGFGSQDWGEASNAS